MNHDYAHCADFKDDCPKKCFRAKLVRDLQKYGKLAPYGINYPISWMHFKGTEECELSAECRQCSHLVTFATDTNVGTKYESYKEVTE